MRKKYACTSCETNGENPSIQAAKRPETAIDKGLAGSGLLAYIVTSKYSDYLPLYRLEDIFARQGFEISRATQSVWCGNVADFVEPLYHLMADRVRASHVVATDDTIMPMQSKDKVANARMWVYVGDEAQPYNVFDFTMDRSRDGPKRFLKDYGQVLLADGYAGYNGVVVGNAITRAGCWAHMKRKIIDAEKSAPDIAREAVQRVRALSAVERQGKDASIAERLKLRREQSALLLAELQDRLLQWKQQLLPKHPMAEAINYALGQWNELNVFCSDGALPIDNNVSEREMKRVVLNRKNSLFVGNARGGRTAAILASLTSTCRRHDVDPQHYLTQLLINLPTTRMSELSTWLPDQWKQLQAARMASLQSAAPSPRRSRKGNSSRSRSEANSDGSRSPLRSPVAARPSSLPQGGRTFPCLCLRTTDGLLLCRPSRKLHMCERWRFHPPQRLLLSPAAYELPPLTVARHPNLVEIVGVSILPKEQAPAVLTVLLPGRLDQHQILLLGGLGVDERKIPRCLQ